MATGTREAVMEAVFAIVNGMSFSSPIMGLSTWAKTSRRLALWSDVDNAQKPYAALVTHSETDDYTGLGLSRRRLNLQVWCYARTEVADSSSTPGQTIIDNMMEAFDQSFGQNAVDNFFSNQNTLGDLVYWCRIQGRIFKDPGDIDSDVMLIVPLVIEMP